MINGKNIHGILQKLFVLLFCNLFFFLNSQKLFAQPNKQFVFTDLDGLPRNIITCIDKDKYGYLWIGTDNGVSRYDGNTFVNYKQTSGYRVRDLIVDENNSLWVITYKGLFLLNRISDEFELIHGFEIQSAHFIKNHLYISTNSSIYRVDKDQLVEIKKDVMINDFLISENGIWYSNVGQGVKFCIPTSGISGYEKKYLNDKTITIIRAIDDKILFGSSDGSIYVHNALGKPYHIAMQNNSHVMDIIKVNNEVWVATDGDGILVFNQDLKYKFSFKKQNKGKFQLISNSIYNLLCDQNRVWVASYGAGLTCLITDKLPFVNIVPESNNANSLVAQEGVGVYSDGNTLILGTNYGMSVFNEKLDTYNNFSIAKLKRELKGTKITTICRDNNSNYWIGAYEGLIGKYNADFKLLKTYHPCSDDENEMQRIVFSHFATPYNLIFVSQNIQKTVFNFDLEAEKFYPVMISKNDGLKDYFQVTSIRQFNDTNILMSAVHHGILHLNMEKNTLENRLPKVNQHVDFFINDFYKDKAGTYWIVSNNQGLICISEDGTQVQNWTISDGFPSNTLLRIETVDDTNLWISSIQGLCKFNMQTEQVQVFNHTHGLSANEFSKRTSTKTHDGRMVFGSVAGFSIIDQELIKPVNTKTEVLISNIVFQNKGIRSFTEEPLLTKPLEETKHLILPYDKNSFTIHFFSKDKDFPKYNNYAYRLVGLEKEWIYIGQNRHTTYTNLSPGEYVFEVKSTNKSNIWSKTPTQLSIKIKPPWYSSWYGYLFYYIIIMILLYVAWRISTNRIKLKKEVEMSEFKLKQEHELTERKLAFFTSVSHDLKTPLTLIDAPVNEILGSEDLSHEVKSKLHVVLRNSKRLYRLINDLLDFRKMSQDQLPLKVSETNIVTLFNTFYESIKEELSRKSIEFEKSIEAENSMMIDAEKVEKILWNLVSNAIKYTPEGGVISLKAEEKKINNIKHLILKVTDTGIGIPAEEHEKVFERFYQSTNNSKQINEGSGIGLSIVKDLVQLHHGNIRLQSIKAKGTAFTISLPAEAACFRGEEISTNQVVNSNELLEESEYEVVNSEQSEELKYNLQKLLIVEDNEELRHYLVDFFAKKFKVIQARDGMEGLVMVTNERPDIIITDVVMPNKDGYELCNDIRSNFDTSHLPIIMLTSNSLTEQQIEGISLGADAYVTKPFDITLLQTILFSVLNNRKKIREKLMGVDLGNDIETKLSALDNEFIENLKAYIFKNLSDCHLNIDFLTEHFSLSRTQLNRKIKSLTGQTPNNVIKSIRLKEAYKLIKEQGLRISEAAYQTGFSDPNYFTICFKREFGESPSKI